MVRVELRATALELFSLFARARRAGSLRHDNSSAPFGRENHEGISGFTRSPESSVAHELVNAPKNVIVQAIAHARIHEPGSAWKNRGNAPARDQFLFPCCFFKRSGELLNLRVVHLGAARSMTHRTLRLLRRREGRIDLAKTIDGDFFEIRKRMILTGLRHAISAR